MNLDRPPWKISSSPKKQSTSRPRQAETSSLASTTTSRARPARRRRGGRTGRQTRTASSRGVPCRITPRQRYVTALSFVYIIRRYDLCVLTLLVCLWTGRANTRINTRLARADAQLEQFQQHQRPGRAVGRAHAREYCRWRRESERVQEEQEEYACCNGGGG
jgi:hypothetical protein